MMNPDGSDVTDGYAERESGISPRLDVTLDLLSNRRRRYVLYYLRKQGGTVSVEELASQIAVWEGDEAVDDERVIADLHHTQLPRLDEAGAVAYDSESGFVTLASDDETPLTEYLELAANEENVV